MQIKKAFNGVATRRFAKIKIKIHQFFCTKVRLDYNVFYDD